MTYVYGLLALAAGLIYYYITYMRRELGSTQARLVVQKAIADTRAQRMKALEAQLKKERDAKRVKDDADAEAAAGSPDAARKFLLDS